MRILEDVGGHFFSLEKSFEFGLFALNEFYRNDIADENGFEPKKPRRADSGLG